MARSRLAIYKYSGGQVIRLIKNITAKAVFKQAPQVKQYLNGKVSPCHLCAARHNSKKYVYITKEWVDSKEWESISLEQLVLFETEQEAQAAGYTPKKCESGTPPSASKRKWQGLALPFIKNQGRGKDTHQLKLFNL